VTIQGKELDGKGMLIDFKMVKDILKEEVIDKLDHYDLNEIPPFSASIQNFRYNPTAENIARFTYEKLKSIKGLIKVRVYESPDCWAEFYEY